MLGLGMRTGSTVAARTSSDRTASWIPFAGIIPASPIRNRHREHDARFTLRLVDAGGDFHQRLLLVAAGAARRPVGLDLCGRPHRRVSWCEGGIYIGGRLAPLWRAR